jgi:hypothetical protein
MIFGQFTDGEGCCQASARVILSSVRRLTSRLAFSAGNGGWRGRLIGKKALKQLKNSDSYSLPEWLVLNAPKCIGFDLD